MQGKTSSRKVPKLSRRGLIAILTTIAVVVVAVIVAVFVYVAQTFVSSQDYQRFATQTDVVIANYNSSITATGQYLAALEDADTSEKLLAQKAASATSAYAKYLESVKALATERALKNTDIKQAYDIFISAHDKFVAGNAAMAATLPVIHTISVNCSEEAVGSMDTSNLGKLVASYDKAASPCVDSMKQLAASKDGTAAAAGAQAIKFFDTLRTRVVSMQAAYKADDRDKFKSEYNAFIKKTESFDKDTDITKVTQYQDAISPASQLNALAAKATSYQK